MKKKTKVINFFGGPGIGKTATALGLTALMKTKGISCEYVSEYAKDLTWEDNKLTLDCQPAIAGEQIKRLHKVDGQVDFIVTDSPLLINLLHPGFGVTDNYKIYLVEVFNMFDNINFLLTADRNNREYEANGRIENKERAIEMDKENIDMINKYNIPFELAEVNDNLTIDIFNFIKEKYINKNDNKL